MHFLRRITEFWAANCPGFVFLFTFITIPFSAFAEVEALLGGNFIDPTKRPFALIDSSDGSCSGVLVGGREVLTVAHCVFSPVEDYVVWVGGKRYSVDSAYYNYGYDFFGIPSLENARFDLGILILKDKVENVAPYPILTELPLQAKDPVTAIGFGSYEEPGFISSYSDAKAADMVLTEVSDGLLYSHYSSSTSIICSGDSGGPLVIRVGNHNLIAGLGSLGTSENDRFGICSVGGGESVFVDVQSVFSQRFLRSFDGITFVSGQLAYFSAEVAKVSRAIQRLLKEKKLPRLRTGAKSLLTSLKPIRRFADARRSATLTIALQELKRAATSRTTKGTRLRLQSARKALKELVSLGVTEEFSSAQLAK